MRRILKVLLAAAIGLLALVYAVGIGLFGERTNAGVATGPAIAPAFIAAKEASVRDGAAAVGVPEPKQILFGDLHVHSTFSFDAFTLSLPMSGGDGAHPVSDACDFARYCSSLDFFSINDHDLTLTPKRWDETIAAIRQCNAIAGDASNPDLVTYLGWEWTQVGATPETHYGHKNVILRGLGDDEIPPRPIAAGSPLGVEDVGAVLPNPFIMGAYGLYDRKRGGIDLVAYQAELAAVQECPRGVPVRDLPRDCRESATTPAELFAKLDDWGFDSIVIPHGTTWGFYTPLGSAWDKQLTAENHDPDRQKLIEVFSGHGNSEELRAFREVVVDAQGKPSCPEPNEGYLPSCWRAGEIIESRCQKAGLPAVVCSERAARTRQLFVEAKNNGGAQVVPETSVADWQDAGQCRDCFQPAFNYRPKSSVQYIMALGRRDAKGEPMRFELGFIASSDNHSARPGTGYKEVARSEFTESRFGHFRNTPVAFQTKSSGGSRRARPLRVRRRSLVAAGRLRDRARRVLLPERRSRRRPRDRARSRFDLAGAGAARGLRHQRSAHPALVRSRERPRCEAAADGKSGRARHRTELRSARRRLSRAGAGLRRRIDVLPRSAAAHAPLSGRVLQPDQRCEGRSRASRSCASGRSSRRTKRSSGSSRIRGA